MPVYYLRKIQNMNDRQQTLSFFLLRIIEGELSSCSFCFFDLMKGLALMKIEQVNNRVSPSLQKL